MVWGSSNVHFLLKNLLFSKPGTEFFLTLIVLTDSAALQSAHRRDRYPPISVNQYLYQHDHKLFLTMKKQLYFPSIPPSEGEESQGRPVTLSQNAI